MSVAGQPLAKFGVVFRNPDQIGRIIDATEENAHRTLPLPMSIQEIRHDPTEDDGMLHALIL
jgi:hypothetical protein